MVELAGDEHQAGHSRASDFVRWGSLGGLETLRRYGRPWFALLGRRCWKRVGAEAFAAYRPNVESTAYSAGVPLQATVAILLNLHERGEANVEDN